MQVKRFTNKEKYTTAGICMGSLLLSILYCPFFDPFFDDKEIFRYIGMVMYKGGVPYRDVFDHKPPLIYLLNEWGVFAGPWGFWIVDTLLVLSATWMFFSLCRRYQLAYPWLLPLLFNLLLRLSIVSFGIGMTREYTAIFLILFFCFLLQQKRIPFYLLGLFSGLIFFMQQDTLLAVLPFLLYAFFQQPHLQKIGALGAGFGTIALPIFLYFALHKSLPWFWEDAFSINTRLFKDSGTFSSHFKIIKTALQTGEYELIFYPAMILGIVALTGSHQKKGLLVTALSANLLAFAPEFLSGRLKTNMDFIYYLLPLAATLPILVFVIFTGSNEAFIREKKAQLTFGLIMSVLLVLGDIRYLSATLSRDNPPKGIAANAPYGQAVAELSYLEQQPLKDYQLYVFFNSNLIYAYNRFGILSPSKWIFQYFWTWYPWWDQDGRILESIIGDLRLHKTDYILDCSDTAPDFKGKSAYQHWKSFLRKEYKPVVEDRKGTILWKRQ